MVQYLAELRVVECKVRNIPSKRTAAVVVVVAVAIAIVIAVVAVVAVAVTIVIAFDVGVNKLTATFGFEHLKKFLRDAG